MDDPHHLSAARAQAPTRPVSVYVAVGAKLLNHVLAPDGGIAAKGSLGLPSRLQYAWPHPVLPLLYAVCADRSVGAEGQPFYLCALARDGQGDLSLLQPPVTLPSRPIHVTTDAKGDHVLTAFSTAPGLMVHRLDAEGRIGAEIPRDEDFDMGNNPHQIRVLPDDTHAVLVARGRKGAPTMPERQGALKVLRFRGRVSSVASICPSLEEAPEGFNPRHLDFHPSLPLAFVALEVQNRLCTFRLTDEGIAPEPLSSLTTLEHPEDMRERQDCGTVHVHPDGRHIYVCNRNDGYLGGHRGPSWLTPDPLPEFPGGENNIAVFELRRDEPRPVQHQDSRGLHPRTFALDPAGRILVAGNLAPTLMRQGDDLVRIPANLAVFRVGDDGRLTFQHRFDIDVGQEMIWWMGIVG